MNPKLNIIFTLTFIFLINLALSTPVFSTSNLDPQPGESIVGTISSSGTLLEEITRDDISFYEGEKEIFPDYDLYYFDNVYYLSVVFLKEGDFRLETNEILFNLAGESGSKKIEHTFNVKYSNYNNETNEYSNLLSIKPGIIYTLSTSSDLRLFNRGNNDLSITIGDNNFVLGAYQAKIINVNLVEKLSFINIKTYKNFNIPVIYLGIVNNSVNETITEIVSTNILFRPNIINLNLTESETRIRELEVSNTGDYIISNFSLISSSENIKVEFPEIINPKETKNLEISVTGTDSEYSEELIINYLENNHSFNLSIPVIVSTKEISNNDISLSCVEYGGTLCDEKCDGESNLTSDGFCCYGSCVPFDAGDLDNGSGNGVGIIVGLLIFIALGIVGFILIKKYRKVEKIKPEKKIEESKDKFESRMKGAVSRN